jgi:hypothetical protein
MFRKIVVVIALLTLLATAWPRVVRAATLDPEQIKAALRTATSEDGGFIDKTVAMVNAGTLPAALFESSMQWARKKPHNQFQYFKHALILRAAAVGIDLSTASGGS